MGGVALLWTVMICPKIASDASVALWKRNQVGVAMETYASVMKKARIRRNNSNGLATLSAITPIVSATFPGTTESKCPTDLSRHERVRSDSASHTETRGGVATAPRHILPWIESTVKCASGNTML